MRSTIASLSLLVVAQFAASSIAQVPVPPGVKVGHDLVFAKVAPQELTLDLYRPEGPGRCPAIWTCPLDRRLALYFRGPAMTQMQPKPRGARRDA